MVSHRNAVMWALIAVAVTGSVSGAEPVTSLPVPVEFRPYDVRLALSVDEASRVNGRECLDAITKFVARCIGPRWTLTAAPAPPSATWAIIGDVNRVSSADWKAFEALTAEALYCVAIRQRAPGLAVQLLSSEPLTGFRSPPQTVQVNDPRDVAGAIVKLMYRTFRPRALWERIDDDTVRLRIQAGGFAVPDPDLPLVAHDTVFTPWLITRSRSLTIERKQSIPWTYLVPQELEEGSGLADIVTGLRAPLSMKTRGKVERLAVAARPLESMTRLEVIARGAAPRPLAAHRVEWVPWAKDEQSETPATLQAGLTDRLGRLDLAQPSDVPLVWVTVYSGSLQLAKVPCLPGEAPQLRLEVPDDAVRLRVEGQLEMLQGQLIDAIAVRSALVATIRSAVKKNQRDTYARDLAKLEALPGRQVFLERLAAIRVTGVAEARLRQDRTSEQRVGRMCSDATELVNKFIDDDKIKLQIEDMRALKDEFPDPADLKDEPPKKGE